MLLKTLILHTGFRIRIHLIWIRIQRLRLDPDPDPDPIRIQGFNDQKLKTKYGWKKKLNFFLSKTAIYLSLGLHKVQYVQVTEEACSSQKRPSNIFSTFVGHFCPPGSGSGSGFRIRFRTPNPVPDSESGSGSGSTARLNPDPIRIQIQNPDYISKSRT